MGYFFETVSLLAAILADFWFGNYGLTPYLSIFVLFHASECVSMRFAVFAAVLTGFVVDVVYCRGSSGMPLLFVSALFAGRLILFRREGEVSGGVSEVLLPGAAIGAVMAAGEVSAALWSPAAWNWFDEFCRLVSGALFGMLEMAAILTVMDFFSGFLGLSPFFKAAKSRLNGNTPRERMRRIRAGSMVRKSK